MSERRARRWPLRLVQLSPLVALALLALFWFSVPAVVAPTLALLRSTRGEPAVTPAGRTSLIDLIAEGELATSLGVGGQEPNLESATRDSWGAWTDSLGAHVTTAAVLAPAQSGAPSFAAIAEWERTHDARVWAWVVPGPVRPPVVASATADPDSLFSATNDANAMIGQPPVGGVRRPTDFVDWLWWNLDQSPGALPQLSIGMLQISGGSGGGSAGWQYAQYGVEGGGKLYPVVVIGPGDPYGTNPMPQLDEIMKLDPDTPGFSEQIAKLAAERHVNIWVFGPAELGAYPLRMPAGATVDEAARLGAAVWPSYGIQRPELTSPIRTLDASLAALAGGPIATMQVTSVNNTDYFSTSGGVTGSFGKKDVAPQAVAFLAVWNSAPAAPGPLESAWMRWQRFVVGWFPFLLGGAVAFLGLTLVASPTAFVYERRLVARERIREEMARMRRDVHDRVYNRLSALSKRIAATGDDLNADNAAALATIAEDIRSTVGDLQEILGDEVRHTNSALTSVPLSEQIASVCAAQAARLGVAIACEADDSLPEVDALLGWDLQCITEEAITNAVRHGAATHVGVRLTLADSLLELSVTDNGGGTTVRCAAEAPDGSTGLRGVADRLARRGGELRLLAGEPGGTVLVATIPHR